MRRLLFVDHASVVGGGEEVLCNLTAGLADRKYQVFLVAPAGMAAEKAAAAGAEVIELELPRFFSQHKEPGHPAAMLAAARELLGGLRKLGGIIEKLRPDIVHTNSNKAHLLGRAAVAQGVPLIWHMHDLLAPEFFSATLMAMLAHSARRHADRIIAVSRAVGEALTEKGVQRNKIRVVYNGCPDRAFRSPALRHQLGVEEGTLLVGMVGRISPWKGQHVFLEAASLLDRQNIRYLVIGGALFGEDSYLDEMKSLADRLGIGGRTTFTGYLEGTGDVYPALDVVVHASILPEPFGLVIVEAMLAGCPVIAARAGGPAEIVTDGYDGLLFTPGKAAELASGIDCLLQDPDRAATMGKRGRITALRKFSIESMLDGVEIVYNELMT